MRTHLIAATIGCLLLVGCAGDEAATGESPTPVSTSASATPPDSPSATPSATPTAPETVVISVAQADGSVTPAPERVPVPLGSPVRLTVTSDVADEIHVHGYELEQPVAAGGSTTFRFTADQAGLFEVEAHETALQLLQLQVS